MKQNGKHPMPPWVRDRNPELWCSVSIAARFYFRKSIVTVKRYIKEGTLEENGIPSYWDGTRWFVRLPEAIFDQSARTEKTVRRSA